MAEYVLYSKNIDDGFEKKIEEDIYKELYISKEILSEAHSKENVYGIVLNNYYEFEKELFDITLQSKIFYQFSHFDFNRYALSVGQRLLNLLSSITLYLDSFKNDLRDNGIEKYPDCLEDEFVQVRTFINNSVKFKIMRHIRNHIQHNGLLVKGAGIGGENLPNGLLECTIKAYVNKSDIRARDFQVDDFKDISDEIDLKKIIREYVDFISKVHYAFREAVGKKSKEARCSFEYMCEKYSKYNCLYVAKKVNDIFEDEIPILLDWDDVRNKLISKNLAPKYFSRHFISTI